MSPWNQDTPAGYRVWSPAGKWENRYGLRVRLAPWKGKKKTGSQVNLFIGLLVHYLVNNLEVPFRVCLISWQWSEYVPSSTDTRECGLEPSSRPSERRWNGTARRPFCCRPVQRSRGSSPARDPCSSH